MVKLIYWRYYKIYEEEFDTLDKAITASNIISENGNRWVDKIIDGDKVYKDDELFELQLKADEEQ